MAAQTGAPLRRAQIRINSFGSGVPLRVTTTDTEGRYEFADLPAGRFGVNASKPGYVALSFGQRRPNEAGTPVTVADGQTVERIDFALSPGSVIAVRVTDEFGEPVVGAQVTVRRYQYGPDGRRQPQNVVMGTTGLAGTDDRGEFRAYGLVPGEYLLMASVRNASGPAGTAGGNDRNDTQEGLAPTYYPGTASAAQATAVSLGIGEEAAIQFALVPGRMSRVSGRVVNSEGEPVGGAQLEVVTASGGGSSSYGTGQTALDGTFTLSGIAVGEYTLRVTHRRAIGNGESASMPLVLGGSDITGLQIVTGPGAVLSGRVVFEGTAPRRSGLPVQMRVIALSADSQNPISLLGTTDPLSNGSLADDGSFKLAGVNGRVFVTVPAPSGWMLKSVTVDGGDISDTPIDMTGRSSLSGIRIVLTDKLTKLVGQVMSDSAQWVKDCVVIVQPAERKEPVVASRLIRVVRPDTNGRFETRGLQTGRYIATAIESLEEGRQFAPEFQEQLRRGAREFSLRENESVTLELSLTRGF